MNGPNVKPVVAVVVVAVLAEGILKANPVGAAVVPPCVAAPKLKPPARHKKLILTFTYLLSQDFHILL